MDAERALARDAYERKRILVLDSEMAFVEAGAGEPIVLLHGNPTSSYLWRNVIPHLEGLGRCLAPDLIGMGESGKTGDGRYRFLDHARYLDAWFEALGLRERVALVGHDWGGVLAFHWAARNPARVRALAYMETIVRPLRWDDWPEPGRRMFQALRSPSGEELVLEQNVFIERILPASVLRKLSEAEMEAYRRPYREPGEGRRPMLTWPRELPIEGEPADVITIVEGYGRWLARSDLPKLFVNGDPGLILTGEQRAFCRTWPNQAEVTVKGLHFLQEDSPLEIGRALADFIARLASTSE